MTTAALTQGRLAGYTIEAYSSEHSPLNIDASDG
jgi:hypothetical protein